METIIAVAIGILVVIFLSALIALLFVCRHKYCRSKDLISHQHDSLNRANAELVVNESVYEHDEQSTAAPIDSSPEQGVVELSRVNPTLDGLISNEIWVNDASGLAPHCLKILRTCHLLSEKLVATTLSDGARKDKQEEQFSDTLTEVVATARRISPRVDEVAQALYPPLDPRLLEARCAALVLSVSHLILVTRSACQLSGSVEWIDQALLDVEKNLNVLRTASLSYENSLKSLEADVDESSRQPIIMFPENST